MVSWRPCLSTLCRIFRNPDGPQFPVLMGGQNLRLAAFKIDAQLLNNAQHIFPPFISERWNWEMHTLTRPCLLPVNFALY
ncbi:hypothetical protein EG68_01095 [Paragonimus skrjabini miyazakii]|uniref:Uncharacterized protein n=1 Tax=Paragonimus skrjabini miyazakii TaxID=59628 RepID=A0A8S9ZCC8_9TREM|nr:hypothetical protein EG68_01095 [Paragonimus skrjabini miyazakii]